MDQGLIRVPRQTTIPVRQPIDKFGNGRRVRAVAHKASKKPELIDALCPGVGEHGAQCRLVGLYIGKDSDLH